MRELVVDLFAGGGGASTGLEMAGLHVDIAINHDADAIAMHQANHPDTLHYREDVFEVNPLKVTKGQPVGLLWASPDCTHFSKAKGGKPVKKEIRSLAWVVVNWAQLVKPRIIMLENVPEFRTWGPIGEDNQPIKERAGETFSLWLSQLKGLGYKVEFKELRACDYGSPTIRTRLFMIARCDGQPIVWPEPTHGEPGNLFGLPPFKTAADCIDWSIPGHSIFMTKEEATGLRKKTGIRVVRPLAEHTMKRIALGVKKFILDAQEPFVIPIDHKSSKGGGVSINDKLRTITCENRFALVSAFIKQYNTPTGNGSRCYPADAPLNTVVTSNRFGVVSTFLSKYYGGVVGSKANEPLHTVTAIDHNALVSAFLMKYYGAGIGSAITEPAHTVTTKERFGLVMIHGVPYQITDITLRMLTPRELANAQGFPAEYIMTGSKSSQVARIGNSVCPQMAMALAGANCAEEVREVVSC